MRHGLAVLFHLSNVLVSTQQMNLSVTIPAMVNVSAQPGAPTGRPPAPAQGGGNDSAQAPEALVSVPGRRPSFRSPGSI